MKTVALFTVYIPLYKPRNQGYSPEVVLKPWNQWSEDASSTHSLYTSVPDATLACGMKVMNCNRLMLFGIFDQADPEFARGASPRRER